MSAGRRLSAEHFAEARTDRCTDETRSDVPAGQDNQFEQAGLDSILDAFFTAERVTVPEHFHDYIVRRLLDSHRSEQANIIASFQGVSDEHKKLVADLFRQGTLRTDRLVEILQRLANVGDGIVGVGGDNTFGAQQSSEEPQADEGVGSAVDFAAKGHRGPQNRHLLIKARELVLCGFKHLHALHRLVQEHGRTFHHFDFFRGQLSRISGGSPRRESVDQIGGKGGGIVGSHTRSVSTEDPTPGSLRLMTGFAISIFPLPVVVVVNRLRKASAAAAGAVSVALAALMVLPVRYGVGADSRERCRHIPANCRVTAPTGVAA